MKRLIITSLCLLLTSSIALGDWAPGDDYKMHFPQLPDPTGWDVTGSQSELADDFLCTETGPITDVHFWGSWIGDDVGTITQITVLLYDNITADQNPYGSWSMPGTLIASLYLPAEGDFTVRNWGTGDQGWYYPGDGYTHDPVVIPGDHEGIYQVNITGITDPDFYQVNGEIYWLGLYFVTDEETADGTAKFGWKTSQDHYEDDAVYYGKLPDSAGGEWTWLELIDPQTEESLDMAFVITPEPATIALLGLGALSLIRRKR